MPPWKQNRVIYTKQELSWDKPLCRGREVQERGVKKFTGVLRIPAISSNFWLFMFFYPSLSLAVTLVSHGGPGFKLVAVLLLTFGSRSELLHILTDLSGVASSCKLICPPPPRLGRDLLAAAVLCEHASCPGTVLPMIIYFQEVAFSQELICPCVRAALSASCCGCHGHPASRALQAESGFLCCF